MLITNATVVEAESCVFRDNHTNGIMVDEGRLTLRDCEVRDNHMNGVVASAVKKGQSEGSVRMYDTEVHGHDMAGVASIYGGWVFIPYGCRIHGYGGRGQDSSHSTHGIDLQMPCVL